MQIKRFRGADMADALQQVKKVMGNDAIILSTRQVRGGGGTFGLFGKPMLEVTAAQDTDENGGEASSLLAALPKGLSKNKLLKSFGARDGESLRQMMAKSRVETQHMLAPLQDEIQELKEILHRVGNSQKEQLHEVSSMERMQAEIADMRQMLHSMANQSNGLREADLPENLVVLFQQLTFSGMEDKFAKRIVEESARNIPANEMEDFTYVKIFVARMLMKIIQVTGGVHVEPNRQKTIALVGPTGVGKTTTVAKLASEQHLKYRRSVGLITIDTFRIAAVEQLKVYAKIMGLPITVVSGKEDLDRAIRDFSQHDVVFIDTGGRSQRDDMQMAELFGMFGAESPVDVFLTISATTKDTDQIEITRRFGQIPLAGVVYTKLDESTTYGPIFNHSIRFKTPIGYLTTGQKVPEDIEVATKERLVDLLLNIAGN